MQFAKFTICFSSSSFSLQQISSIHTRATTFLTSQSEINTGSVDISIARRNKFENGSILDLSVYSRETNFVASDVNPIPHRFKNVTAHNPCIPFAWSHALLTYHRCAPDGGLPTGNGLYATLRAPAPTKPFPISTILF